MNKENIKFGIVNLSIFFAILFLNYLTPMAADDYAYSFILSTTERVNSFADVFRSQCYQYVTYGGRIVAHSFAQIFLWWGKPIFNFVNAAMFIVYINLISLLAFSREQKKSVKTIISSFLIAWFMLPVIGSVIFWLTGSCNYLWGTTFVFAFIYRYYNCLFDITEKKESIFKMILWFLFGVVAGWCNENTSGMGIMVCCLLTLYKYKKHLKIWKWQIAGIIGAILGFSLLMLAPGNYARVDLLGPSISPFQRYLNAFILADMRAFRAEGIYKILFFIFLFTYLFVLITSVIDKERKIVGGIWFLGALACNFAMILSPSYPDRASFGVYSMYFVSIFYSGRTIVEYFDKQWIMNVVKVLICISCLYFSISYLEAVYDIGLTKLQDRERISIVLSEKSKDNYDISVQGVAPKTKYNVFYSIHDWPDYGVAQYYSVNSITINE